MDQLKHISIILPSLDPDEKLLTVVDGLLSQGFSHIVLINDGSKPENLHYFDTAAQNPQVTLLHHPRTLGKGAALKTGFSWILGNRPDCLGVVTVDGDNQHHKEDITACALQMLKTNHIVLGVRDFSQPDVPPRSRMGNRITSFVFKAFVGMTLSDTQTGLRAIPASYLKPMLGIAGDRFEYETNMLLQMKDWSAPYEELKIRTVYIEENKSSHFRAVRDSVRIYKLIFARFFRFAASSLASSVIEEALVIGLNFGLNRLLSGVSLVAVTTGAARLISSFINFYLNQRLVFRSNGNTGRALARYFALAIPLALGQFALTFGIYELFAIPEESVILRAALYALVMIVLFFASYAIQRRWVFRNQKKED